MGFELKGYDISREFLEFADQEGNIRVKLHPSDDITDYDHMHLYMEGYPLSANF